MNIRKGKKLKKFVLIRQKIGKATILKSSSNTLATTSPIFGSRKRPNQSCHCYWNIDAKSRPLNFATAIVILSRPGGNI
jgi:hypothetical protein